MKRLFVAVFLVLFIVLTMETAKANIGVAVATLSSPIKVGVGESREVIAGRVFNTGNETIAIECSWVQESSTVTLDLPVTIKNRKFHIEPEESVQIILVVGTPDESYLGNYSGYVDVICKPLVMPSDGNPTLPTGGLPVEFIVKYLLPAEFVVYSLNLSKTVVQQYEMFHASVIVKNVGERVGSYNVKARVSGELVETRAVTLAGGEVKHVSFILNVTELGSYVFSVDDCPDELDFTVKPLPKPSPLIDLPLHTILLTAVALGTMSTGLGAVLYAKRKTRLLTKRRQTNN